MKRLSLALMTALLLGSLLAGGCAGAAGTAQITAPATGPATLPATRAPAAAEATRSPGCTVVSHQPTPTPISSSLIPPVGPDDWTQGPDSASITFMEYSDFQCPACPFVETMLARLVEAYPQEVRVVYRHFPLIGRYDKSALAAQAAEAAGAQGKFWEMHDLLYGRQNEWKDMQPAEFQEWLVRQAPNLKLDEAQFSKDLTSTANVDKIQQAWNANAQFMPGAPYVLFNGEPLDGTNLTFDQLNAIVALTLLAKRQYSECPPMGVDPAKQYIAQIETEKGIITLELFADLAPLAVNNFVFLAQNGWYDNTTFHRVIPGFMAQGGDPTGTGFGGPGYAFDNEDSGLTFDQAGLLAMANAGPGSNGSQFFITYAPVERLNGGYTIFGKVLEGMDVLEKLTPRNPAQTPDAPPGDKIITITITEK